MSKQLVEHCPACGLQAGTYLVNHLGFQLRDCHNCGLWFWDDRTPPDYDAVYRTAEYEEVQVNPFQSNCDPHEFLHHPTYAAFFREIPAMAGAPLLDIGCGVGRFLIAARSAGWETRGIDVSKNAVDIGRNGAGLDLSCNTIEQIYCAGDRFCAVTAFEVLEHVQEPYGFVQSAMSLLIEGNWFFCTVPNRESPTVLKTIRPDWLPPVHLQFFTEQALRSLLERAGGANVRTGFVFADPQSANLRSKAKRLTKRLMLRARPDPLGIWGMAQLSHT